MHHVDVLHFRTQSFYKRGVASKRDERHFGLTTFTSNQGGGIDQGFFNRLRRAIEAHASQTGHICRAINAPEVAASCRCRLGQPSSQTRNLQEAGLLSHSPVAHVALDAEVRERGAPVGGSCSRSALGSGHSDRAKRTVNTHNVANSGARALRVDVTSNAEAARATCRLRTAPQNRPAHERDDASSDRADLATHTVSSAVDIGTQVVADVTDSRIHHELGFVDKRAGVIFGRLKEFVCDRSQLVVGNAIHRRNLRVAEPFGYSGRS